MEEGLGALHLEGDEASLRVVADFAFEFLLRVAEALEFFQRKVDAVAGEVFLDVPQDVGELHGEAEVDGVFPGFRVAVAEYLETDETDDGGDPVAVEAEVFEGPVAVVGEVHLDAADKVLEVGLGDFVGLGGVGEGGEDGAVRQATVGRIEAGGELLEGGLLVVKGGDFVDSVVAVATEGVGGVDGAALGGGEGEEGVVEVPGLTPGDEAALFVGVG